MRRAYEELRVGFTAAVSHELRTPLARLLALLETAVASRTPTVTQLLAQARERGRADAELVDDVLFLSELETGREVVALGDAGAPVLEEVRDRLADSAERADVAIRVEAEPEIELPLRRACCRSSPRTSPRTRSATPAPARR